MPHAQGKCAYAERMPTEQTVTIERATQMALRKSTAVPG